MNTALSLAEALMELLEAKKSLDWMERHPDSILPAGEPQYRAWQNIRGLRSDSYERAAARYEAAVLASVKNSGMVDTTAG